MAAALVWLVTPTTSDSQPNPQAKIDDEAAATPASLNATVLFRHGLWGFPCVRTPSLLLAGDRLIAVSALRNYTGDHCYPHGLHPPEREHNADFQMFVMRTSDDSGVTWSPARMIPMNQVNDTDFRLYYACSGPHNLSLPGSGMLEHAARVREGAGDPARQGQGERPAVPAEQR